jgi:catabolite regulation protein CreA
VIALNAPMFSQEAEDSMKPAEKFEKGMSFFMKKTSIRRFKDFIKQQFFLEKNLL